MSLGIVLPKTSSQPRRPAGDAGDFGRRVEALGYDSLWTTEGWGRDSFVELTHVATRTDELGLGTSIVNVYSRTPAVLAMASASLAELSEGRFVLGLGAGHPYSIEGIHGMDWTRPVGRTRETIELVDRFTGGGEFPYRGEVFDVDGAEPFDVDVPVANAALGETNRRVTGKLADGWLPFNIPLPSLESAFETVAEAAREAGRDPGEITVTPWIPTAVSEDREEALSLLRENVVNYVGGFQDDAYKNALAQHFPDQAESIANAERADDHEAALSAVSDEMIRAVGIAGRPEEARAQLAEIQAMAVVDTPIVSVPSAATEAVVDTTVETLAPSA
jgi:alkanesulfonate monooxygenase SsuD/methylene tetrahydromethanopterin reductase-like flavin-dependent oxidoreductase (luciferase family)